MSMHGDLAHDMEALREDALASLREVWARWVKAEIVSDVGCQEQIVDAILALLAKHAGERGDAELTDENVWQMARHWRLRAKEELAAAERAEAERDEAIASAMEMTRWGAAQENRAKKAEAELAGERGELERLRAAWKVEHDLAEKWNAETFPLMTKLAAAEAELAAMKERAEAPGLRKALELLSRFP